MRDNPIAAESQGVKVRRLRFIVFVLAAAGSGLAGAIYYMAQLRITPSSGFQSSLGLFPTPPDSSTAPNGALTRLRSLPSRK